MATSKSIDVAPQSHYTMIGTTRIYSESLGSGPPLILIHGLGGSTRWWRRNQYQLAEHHEVHLVDLPGFGRSSGHFLLARATEDLAAWLWQRGLERVSLVGHSLGGYLAARLAASEPQLVDRLVLVAAAINVPSLSQIGATLPSLPLPFSIMPVVVEDIVRAGPLVLAQVAYELIKTDVRETLAHIQAQTLLIWGDRDSAVPLTVARAALKHLHTAGLSIIPNAGHAPMWEQPLAFNHRLRTFLADLPTEPRAC